MIMAHQNLDQLSQKQRATFMSSTSIKFAGGVSAKDARLFAQEMRCSDEFIQGARKWENRGITEFAGFVKNSTAQAIKVTVPLGSMEKLPTISDEAYAELIEENRRRYCATPDEVRVAAETIVTPRDGGFELGEHEI